MSVLSEVKLSSKNFTAAKQIGFCGWNQLQAQMRIPKMLWFHLWRCKNGFNKLKISCSVCTLVIIIRGEPAYKENVTFFCSISDWFAEYMMCRYSLCFLQSSNSRRKIQKGIMQFLKITLQQSLYCLVCHVKVLPVKYNGNESGFRYISSPDSYEPAWAYVIFTLQFEIWYELFDRKDRRRGVPFQWGHCANFKCHQLTRE